MNRLDQLEQGQPEVGEETFPLNWKDPLELYGSYRKELDGKFLDMNEERKALVRLMERDSRYTPEYVWRNRGHLVSQRIFIDEF
jgi:hypothetical protein